MSGPFGPSRACFEAVAGWLEGDEASSLSHAELKEDLDRRGRDMLPRLLQDHLDLRAQREDGSRWSAPTASLAASRPATPASWRPCSAR